MVATITRENLIDFVSRIKVKKETQPHVYFLVEINDYMIFEATICWAENCDIEILDYYSRWNGIGEFNPFTMLERVCYNSDYKDVKEILIQKLRECC